jgi:GntR family transcriptional repressor for pyruvate dehydrogenase complex
VQNADTYQPLDRRKVYEQIAEQLLDQVRRRELLPGDPLPSERELTESFRVGRSSVREALRMLESQGVITAAHGGTFVVAKAANPLNMSLQLVFALDSEAGIHDLFELRRILDCEAAAFAAERRDEEQLAAIDGALAEMEAALEVGLGEQFVAADLAFHLAVAEATGNRFILYAMQAARGVVRRALEQVVNVPQSPQRALVEHCAVRDAISIGDATVARNAMREHLERVERDAEQHKGVLDV